jgi:hypothetical protein
MKVPKVGRANWEDQKVKVKRRRVPKGPLKIKHPRKAAVIAVEVAAEAVVAAMQNENTYSKTRAPQLLRLLLPHQRNLHQKEKGQREIRRMSHRLSPRVSRIRPSCRASGFPSRSLQIWKENLKRR